MLYNMVIQLYIHLHSFLVLFYIIVYPRIFYFFLIGEYCFEISLSFIYFFFCLNMHFKPTALLKGSTTPQTLNDTVMIQDII